MELRQLQYFAAVARQGHFGRAAEELYVTQSAVSQQVRRLEDELGLQLLQRTSQGVELTPAGADLLAGADRVLAEVAQLRARLDEHTGLQRGAVRVATTPADALRLPGVLAAFHQEHPGIQIALRQGAAAEVVLLTQRGTVDLALMSARERPPGVHAIALAQDPLWIVLPDGDPLADAGDVALWDLRDRAFVLPEAGTALRDTVMSACAAAGFSPVPRFEVGDPATVRFLVHAGLGVAVVPASWLDHPQPGPAVVPVRPRDPLHPQRLFLLQTPAGLSPAGHLLAARLKRELSGAEEPEEPEPGEGPAADEG